MGDTECCLPPEALNELVKRIEKIEEIEAAIEGGINAFIAVFAVRRLPLDGDGS